MSAYYLPETLDDALTVLSQTHAVVAAGCTDLYPATEKQEFAGPVLDLTNVAGLRGVISGPDRWRIGATTTWSEILAADLPPAFDMLKQAAREVGSPQIQNAGTIVGNLCNASPAADGMPPLLALDAEIEISNETGQRIVPLSTFVTGARQTVLRPGELVSAVLIPQSACTGRSRFIKLGARKYLVISIAMVAVRLSHDGERVQEVAISVGSCSAVASRMRGVEACLKGQSLANIEHLVAFDDVADGLSPISDMRGDANFRVTAATELTRRALAEIIGSQQEQMV